MKQTVRKVKQAAAALSGFSFGEAEYYHVLIYFRKPSGSSIACGKTFGKDDEARFWGKTEWADYINEWYESCFGDAKPECRPHCLESISVYFTIESGKQKGSYHVEMTDLRSGVFDRIIIYNSLDAPDALFKEAYLTEPESRQIRGTSDVVKITREMPTARRKAIGAPMPSSLARDQYLFEQSAMTSFVEHLSKLPAAMILPPRPFRRPATASFLNPDD